MKVSQLFSQLGKLMEGQKELPITATFEPEFNQLYLSYATNPSKLKLLDIEGISPEKIDVGAMSHKYFTHRLADTSIDMNANANEEKSANNYQAEITKGILKLEGYYLLWRYAKKRFGLDRANELIKAIWDGDVYFHDASGAMIQMPYCIAFSTTPIMVEGRPYGQLKSLVPKRSDSFVAQVIEVCMDMSQEFAGAVSPSDFIVNLCYYLKNEGVDLDTEEGIKYVINQWQKFVHVMNNKFRISGQSPFTNISIFDKYNLARLFEDYHYIDGSTVDIDYVMKVQKICADWFSEGDPATGLPYRFPVMTANMAVDDNREIMDEEFLDFVAAANTRKGVFNIYANEGSKIATCCRLVNDKERMKYRVDSFGNGGLNIGSHRVVTINFPRLAMEADTEEEFWKLLEKRILIAKDLLIVHREEILGRRIDQGFLKFFRPLEWFNIDMFFSTVGITGLYEMCYFLGMPMETEEGQEFTLKVLRKVEEYCDNFSEECGYSFNAEEIPGESTVITLARKDRIKNNKQTFEMYSNQYLPLIVYVDPIDRIKISGKFMNEVSGGGILHLNIAEQIKNVETMKDLIRKTIKAGVPHMAVNFGFGECENGHVTICGNAKICSICGGEIKDWMTRVVGYFTKVSSWGDIRKNFEFPQRKFK